MAQAIARYSSFVERALRFVRICVRLDMSAGIVMVAALFAYLFLHSS